MVEVIMFVTEIKTTQLELDNRNANSSVRIYTILVLDNRNTNSSVRIYYISISQTGG